MFFVDTVEKLQILKYRKVKDVWYSKVQKMLKFTFYDVIQQQ